jgi:hypothetical protein
MNFWLADRTAVPAIRVRDLAISVGNVAAGLVLFEVQSHLRDLERSPGLVVLISALTVTSGFIFGRVAYAYLEWVTRAAIAAIIAAGGHRRRVGTVRPVQFELPPWKLVNSLSWLFAVGFVVWRGP